VRERDEGELDGKVSVSATNTFPSPPPVPPSGAPPRVMGEKKVREEACGDRAARLRRLVDSSGHARSGGGCRGRGHALVAWKDLGDESERRTAHLSHLGITAAANLQSNGSRKMGDVDSLGIELGSLL
jgi:hypothetical protein